MTQDTEKFEGFDAPTENWSKLPHTLINHLHLMTSEAEVKVVLYILRHTWGYGDEQKKITIDEFCNGRKRKDGSRIDNGTGLSENAVRDGIERAIEHGFIEVAEDATDKARIKRYYQLRGANLGVQKLNPGGAEVEPHLSEVEPRTEKETNREKKRERDSSSDDEEAAVDSKFKQIMNIYCNNIELTPSPMTAQEMEEPDYYDLPVEWWKQAVKIAADNRVRKWSYVRGILDRSRESGLSPQDAGPPDKANGHVQQTPKTKFVYTDFRTGEKTPL